MAWNPWTGWQQQNPNETLTDEIRRRQEAAQQEALRQAMLARQYPTPAFSPTVTINPNWAPFQPNIRYYTPNNGAGQWDPSTWAQNIQAAYDRIQQQVATPMVNAYNATYGAMPQAAQAQAVDPMEAWWAAVSQGTPFQGIPYAGAESALGIGKLLGWGSGASGPSALDWQRFYLDRDVANRQADQWLKEFGLQNEQLRQQGLISQQQYELNKQQAAEQVRQWQLSFDAGQQQQAWENQFATQQFDYNRAQQGWQNNLSQSQFDWQKSLEDWQKNFTANQAAQTQENWLRDYDRQMRADAAGQADNRWARAFQQSQFDWQKAEADRQAKLQKELANYSTFGRRAAPVFSMM